MKKLLIIAMLLPGVYVQAQVKNGNNPNTIDVISLLESETTNKGFLPPGVAPNRISSISPLTCTVSAGLLVFSFGGRLTDGYNCRTDLYNTENKIGLFVQEINIINELVIDKK